MRLVLSAGIENGLFGEGYGWEEAAGEVRELVTENIILRLRTSPAASSRPVYSCPCTDMAR